jgi:hypothetical protein
MNRHRLNQFQSRVQITTTGTDHSKFITLDFSLHSGGDDFSLSSPK